ncbi:MAG: prephenate dehydrogenase/arogenate dehydrogenase family protein [Chloroflexi bacterium]|nr:prephenate dehydrogenase/arogenate dehydrogenase family protein [Chloroflexota bacterium]
MRVALIGLGLIGGSLGLALKQARGAELEIIGCARKKETACAATDCHAVDKVMPDPASAVKDCDLVFICTPVHAVREVLAVVSRHAKEGCVVTDVASTKQHVMKWASEFLYPSKLGFVGGHPMAGREKSGIEAASADLLRGCTYCLTPAEWTSSRDVEVVVKAVEWIGAKPYFIEADQHDFLVAAISHLPAAVSVATVAATTGHPDWPYMARLASTGYRDVTRLASGSQQVNADVFTTNRGPLVHWIDELIQALSDLRQQIVDEADGDLEATLAQAREARQRWMEDKWGEQAHSK